MLSELIICSSVFHTKLVAISICITVLSYIYMELYMFVTLLFHFDRNWKYEQELASLLWKIDHKDIRFREQFGFGSIPVTGTMGRVSINIEILV